MKAYKVTLLVVDHDKLGSEGIADVIENVRYPNHCMNPRVMDIVERDIGEWDDDHPLNWPDKSDKEFDRLFGCRIEKLDILTWAMRSVEGHKLDDPAGYAEQVLCNLEDVES